MGVTVHTGTADGGHYYSFIKERNKSAMQHDRWFLFNDAEVKPFDPSQIAAECFGGEMTVRINVKMTVSAMLADDLIFFCANNFRAKLMIL